MVLVGLESRAVVGNFVRTFLMEVELAAFIFKKGGGGWGVGGNRKDKSGCIAGCTHSDKCS